MRNEEANRQRPGWVPAAEYLSQIIPAPRAIHPPCLRWAKLWRMAMFVLLTCASIVWCYWHFNIYLNTGQVLNWLACVALIPITFIYIPWWMITSYRRQKNAFLHCANIYRNGMAVLGNINTITNVNGPEQNCYHVERGLVSASSQINTAQNTEKLPDPRKNTSIFGKVRVDYTFLVENVLKTGSVVLHESSVFWLKANDEVCVIYLPDSPSDSILYPVPDFEFYEMVKLSS